MGTAAEDAIKKNVTGPQRVTVDGVDVEQYDLEDLIKADKHIGSRDALKSGLGVRITRVEPPGATG